MMKLKSYSSKESPSEFRESVPKNLYLELVWTAAITLSFLFVFINVVVLMNSKKSAQVFSPNNNSYKSWKT